MTLHCPSSGDAVTLTDNSNLQGTGSHSVEGWIRYTTAPSSGSRGYMFLKGSTALGLGASIFNSSGNVKASAYAKVNSLDYFTNGATTLSANVWYHIAAVWNSATQTLAIFLNGVSDATATSTVSGVLSHSGDSYLNAPGSTFIGDIDEVRLWGEVRTADQLAANRSRRIAVESANLKGYWRCDGGTVYDFLGVTASTLLNGATVAADSAPITATLWAQGLIRVQWVLRPWPRSRSQKSM